MNKNAKRNTWENRSKVERRPLNIKEYTVTKSAKLLEYLYEIMPDTPKKNVKAILAHHCVSIDGAPVSQFDFEVAKDDVIIISKQPIHPKQTKLDFEIIYEDNEMIVINKPYGMLSVASDKEKSNTAYRLVTSYVQSFDKHNRVYVVHRIDRETSGVLMFAKNEELKNQLQDNWNDCAIYRGYYAICDGIFKEKTGTLKAFLKLNSANMMSIVHDARDRRGAYFCVTNYKVINEKDDYSLVDVNIDSGRKNQIRVMLGSIGHFIAGDDKYGEPTDPLHRLCLHAYNLTIKHPVTGKIYKFESKIPAEFSNFFSKNKEKGSEIKKIWHKN